VLSHFLVNFAAFRSHQDLKLSVVESVCIVEREHARVRVQDGFSSERNATQDAKDEPCDPSFGARSIWSVEGFYADTYRNCYHNDLISLEGRVGKHLPQHDHPEEVLLAWRKLIVEIVPLFTLLIEPVVTPLGFDKWVSTFPPHKRRDFKALKEGGYELKVNKTAKSFLKQELVMRRAFQDDKHKDPRMIQGGPPEMTVACGPYTRKLAKHMRAGLKPSKHNIHDSINNGQQVVYTCGMNSVDIGSAFAEALRYIESTLEPGERLVIIEDDESRFDEHLTEGPFEFIDSMYSQLLPPKIRAHLLRTNKSRGKTSLGTKYTVPYGMQSGFADTSLATSLSNAAMKHRIHGTGRRWITIICGDDSVTVTVSTELERLGGIKGLEAAYAELGMECEIIIREDPLEAEFCSSRFFPCGDTFILMPKVGKFFGRMGWDRINRSPSNQLAWARGVLMTVRSYGKVDPLLKALYDTLSMAIGPGKIIRTYDMENKYSYVPPNGDVPQTTEPDVNMYYATHYGFNALDLSLTIRDIRLMAIGIPSGSVFLHHICDVDS
jgi:hypothetical protein